MKSVTLKILMSVILTALICSCEKEVANESTVSNENGKVTFQTRADTENGSNDGAKISYPVNIYIFDQAGKCVAVKSVENEGVDAAMYVKPGEYQVYAIAGANNDVYELPTLETATKETTIALKSGQTHGNLMAASATATVSLDNENTVALALKRKVMKIGTVTMKNIPSSVSNVYVTISPLYENILLDGNYSGENGSYTVNLTKESDGTTWQTVCDTYLLEAVGNATIKVSLETDEGIQSFSNKDITVLKANQVVNIEGSYNKAAFNATITGEAWGGTQNVQFNFDDETSSTTEPTEPIEPTQPTNVPQMGDIYGGGLVVRTEPTESGTNVLLMSTMHKTEIEFSTADQTTINSVIKGLLANFATEEVPVWRLPTLEEITYVVESVETINTFLSENEEDEFLMESYNNVCNYYFENTEGNVRIYNTATKKESTKLPSSGRDTSILRAFATVSFPNE